MPEDLDRAIDQMMTFDSWSHEQMAATLKVLEFNGVDQRFFSNLIDVIRTINDPTLQKFLLANNCQSLIETIVSAYTAADVETLKQLLSGPLRNLISDLTDLALNDGIDLDFGSSNDELTGVLKKVADPACHYEYLNSRQGQFNMLMALLILGSLGLLFKIADLMQWDFDTAMAELKKLSPPRIQLIEVSETDGLVAYPPITVEEFSDRISRLEQ